VYWTYDIETDIGKVRFLIQDTNPDDPLLGDEEIQFTLDQHEDINLAAATAARTIARRLIRKYNVEVSGGGLSLYRKEQAEMYLKLAEDLESQAGGGAGTLSLLTIPTAAIVNDV